MSDKGDIFGDPEKIEDLKNLAESIAGNATISSLEAYKKILDSLGTPLTPIAKAGRDKLDIENTRFTDPEWEEPFFDIIRQGYSIMSDYILGAVKEIEGIRNSDRKKVEFATQMMVDAMSPANSLLTNPVAINRAIDSDGESLKNGLKNMKRDIAKGQITHTDQDAFTIGENIAVTAGKVIFETNLYQLIQYAPSTPKVMQLPLVIFPPWINRFYILDISPEKSFVKWCVDQGITVFIVSWKSADETMTDVIWDDYISAQIEAIDIVRDLLGISSVNVLGYCVAGTTLAATLSILAQQEREHIVESATFLTTQVDFSEAGELLNFVSEGGMKLANKLGKDGSINGRHLALMFNLLRGHDLIWTTMTKHYLMGEDYPAFDLLHWNGDVSNLPAKWYKSYLLELYKNNALATPNAVSAMGTPIDLSQVKTPSYIQAAIQDHIAPAKSVWKIKDHFKGPMTFRLAGSGHIAGVVNPPAAEKYQYWSNDDDGIETFDAFLSGARETKGSWWPDWKNWLTQYSRGMIKTDAARHPGKGHLKAIEDAPGRYVKTR